MTNRNVGIEFDMMELQALHQEIAARISIQNGAVLLSAPMLLIAGIAMLAWPALAMTAAVNLCAAIGICALVWCHNGVRQCQIKAYLLILAARHSADGGWEHWLPNDRMRGLLGNRWFIATKGALLGAQMFGIALALFLGGPPALLPLLAAVGMVGVTAWLLLSNPKESLSSTVAVPAQPAAT